MTLGLSPQLDAAFGRAGTAVLVTLDGAGHPIATTSRVEHDPAGGCFGLDVALGLPDPHAALVLADGGDDLVLVQGTARPAGAMGVQVRPERVYRWTDGDLEAEPELYDAHLEEVRSAHNEEPEVPHEPPVPEATSWESRLDALAVLERRSRDARRGRARRVPLRGRAAGRRRSRRPAASRWAPTRSARRSTRVRRACSCSTPSSASCSCTATCSTRTGAGCCARAR